MGKSINQHHYCQKKKGGPLLEIGTGAKHFASREYFYSTIRAV